MRDEAGVLTFVNNAYVRAVEAKDASDAVDNSIEMFDRTARTELAKARAAGQRFTGRLPAIAAKERRVFDVVDGPGGWDDTVGYGAAEVGRPAFVVVTSSPPTSVRLTGLDWTFVTTGPADAE